jgi:hypothetical protein
LPTSTTAVTEISEQWNSKNVPSIMVTDDWIPISPDIRKGSSNSSPRTEERKEPKPVETRRTPSPRSTLNSAAIQRWNPHIILSLNPAPNRCSVAIKGEKGVFFCRDDVRGSAAARAKEILEEISLLDPCSSLVRLLLPDLVSRSICCVHRVEKHLRVELRRKWEHRIDAYTEAHKEKKLSSSTEYRNVKAENAALSARVTQLEREKESFKDYQNLKAENAALSAQLSQIVKGKEEDCTKIERASLNMKQKYAPEIFDLERRLSSCRKEIQQSKRQIADLNGESLVYIWN